MDVKLLMWYFTLAPSYQVFEIDHLHCKRASVWGASFQGSRATCASRLPPGQQPPQAEEVRAFPAL